MRRTLVGVSFLLTALVGCAPMTPIVGADSQDPENGAPYCMVDRENPAHLTVAGPAGEAITVDGFRRGNLVLVEGDYAEEVAPDAEPYNGILYNVPGGKRVFVADHECETT